MELTRESDMYYISKKTPIKNIIHNKNFKYYIAILIIFICAIIGIIYAYKHTDNSSDNVGESEEATTVTQDSTTAEAETVPEIKYLIRVNIAKGFLTVYQTEGDNEYDEPYKTMLCAVNSTLAEGTYTSDDSSGKAIWRDLDNSFTRYYTAITESLSFHSSLYATKNDKNTLNTANYAQIGTSDDTTGITLFVSDAKWIYENCSAVTTTVELYSDDKEEPELEYQKMISIPAGITWEPTDTSEGTPWCTTEIDKMSGVKDLSVKAKSSLSVLTASVTALDKDGKDITQYIFITGKFNLNVDGKYKITYNLLDIYGNRVSSEATITVGKGETEEATTAEDSKSDSEPTEEETTTVEQTDQDNEDVENQE